MAATLLQSKIAGSDVNVTSLAVVFDSPPTNGNTMIAFLYTRAATTVRAISESGWAAILDEGIFQSGFALWWKVAGASESSTVTGTLDSENECNMLIAEIQGAHASAPIDQSALTDSGTDSATSETTQSITPGQNGSCVLAFVAVNENSGTFGNGWTNSFTVMEKYEGAASGDVSQSGAFLNQVTAAAISTNESWANSLRHGSVIVNILPAAVGGANPKGPFGMPLHGPFAGPVGP